MTITPVAVAGNRTIHAGRQIGTYASGNARYRKLCSSSRTDNHEPMPVVGAEVTCKRCLAKLPAPAPAAPAAAAAAAGGVYAVVWTRRDGRRAEWHYGREAEARRVAAALASGGWRKDAHVESIEAV